MEKKADDIILFNYYRDAELRGADLVLRLMNRAEDLGLQEPLTRHLADEAQHAWLWTERIRTLGGQPMVIDDRYHRYLRRKIGFPTEMLELLALILVVEERMDKRYATHAARPDVGPETLHVLNEIRADEAWYIAWMTEKLHDLEQSEGKERVTAVLDHYRAREAEAFAELQADEQKARRESDGEPG